MSSLPRQEVETTATSWVTSSSCSVWSAGWCTDAFPVSRTRPSPPRRISSLFPLPLLHPLPPPPSPPPTSALRLEDPLRHQLRQGRLLALPDPDRLLLPLDVLDVPQQCLPLHVGGGAHHVSALPGPTRLSLHRHPGCDPSPCRLTFRCSCSSQIAALGITTNERMNARRYKHFKVTATSIESPFK